MKQGFDNRIVLYEKIHDIKTKDISALIRAVNPNKGQKILDAMCGYGYVGKLLLEKNKTTDLYFIDESSVQIKRARSNLPNLPTKKFINGSLLKSKFASHFFDTVVLKMGLHEVPKRQQLNILNEVRRILKPQGKLVVWDIMLNQSNQKTFQKVIRMKDKLSNFDKLVKERYFFREEEFLANLKQANFRKVKDFHLINYRFSSKRRLVSELKNNNQKLDKLNQYIRRIFPENLRKTSKYKDFGTDIQFNVTKKIYTAQK